MLCENEIGTHRCVCHDLCKDGYTEVSYHGHAKCVRKCITLHALFYTQLLGVLITCIH